MTMTCRLGQSAVTSSCHCLVRWLGAITRLARHSISEPSSTARHMPQDRNKLHHYQSKTIGLQTPEIVVVVGYFWGYLAASGAKYDVRSLLGNLNFLQRWRNFAPISLSFWDLTQDKQTEKQTDRRQIQRPFHKALTLTVCEPNYTKR